MNYRPCLVALSVNVLRVLRWPCVYYLDKYSIDWAHKTRLTPSLFIGVPVPSQ